MKDEKFAKYNPNMFGGDNISYASSPQAAEFESTMRVAEDTEAGIPRNDDYFQKKFAEITGSQAAKSDSQSMAASIDSGIRRKR